MAFWPTNRQMALVLLRLLWATCGWSWRVLVHILNIDKALFLRWTQIMKKNYSVKSLSVRKQSLVLFHETLIKQKAQPPKQFSFKTWIDIIFSCGPCHWNQHEHVKFNRVHNAGLQIHLTYYTASENIRTLRFLTSPDIHWLSPLTPHKNAHLLKQLHTEVLHHTC